MTATSADIATMHEDEVDLLELCRIAWAHKLLIVAVTALCALLSVAYALLATPIYRAQVAVTLAPEAGGGGANALTSQLSGLASLAGVNLGGGASIEREARAVLKSRYLIQHFVERNNLLPTLSRDAKQAPTLWNGVKAFQDNVLDIRDDARQGVTTISMEWTDAATASSWANGFVALANELIRVRTIEEAERNIAYLNGQLAKTNVVELQHVMYNLIEGEQKKLMVANGRVEYAFKVVDPAVTPELRARPRRTVVVIIGTTVGFVLGALAAFAYNAWRPRRSARPS